MAENSEAYPKPTLELAKTDPRVALMFEISDILDDTTVLKHLGDVIKDTYEAGKISDNEYFPAKISESSPERLGGIEARRILDTLSSANIENLQGMKDQYQGIIDEHKSTISYKATEIAANAIDGLKSAWCTVAAAAVDKGGLSEEFAMRTPEYKSTSVHVGRWLLPAIEKVEPFCPEAADKAGKVVSAVTPIKP